jgi:hypothetical protein
MGLLLPRWSCQVGCCGSTPCMHQAQRLCVGARVRWGTRPPSKHAGRKMCTSLMLTALGCDVIKGPILGQRAGWQGSCHQLQISTQPKMQQALLVPDRKGGPTWGYCARHAAGQPFRARPLDGHGWLDSSARGQLKAWGPANQSAWGLTSGSTTRAADANAPTGMHTTARAL